MKSEVLFQNDDGGKDLLRRLRDELAACGSSIASEVSFEVTDPIVYSQAVPLQGSGAEVLFIWNLTPKDCAQAIRKALDISLQLARCLFSGCLHPEPALIPVGFDKAKGRIAAAAVKTVSLEFMEVGGVKAYLAPRRRPTWCASTARTGCSSVRCFRAGSATRERRPSHQGAAACREG